MSDTTAVTVLGAGSYGTALAIVLARNGHRTLLWGHSSTHMQDLAQRRCNTRFLPNVAFPEMLDVTDDLQQAIQATDMVLVVVPSHAFSSVLQQIKPYVRDTTQIVWATKGLEPKTGRLLDDVAREHLGEHVALAVLSGPTFAKEMAAGLPTAISLAAQDVQLRERFAEYLHNDNNLRVYTHADLVGIQLGGAVKNVIAIAAGISDGLGFGANARTALITRGLAEMQRLGLAMGAKPETFTGMAGLGDLVLTCTDNQSRNRRFGLALGSGHSIEQAITDIGQVVEGYKNTEELRALAQRFSVEMPICEQVYQILYEACPASEAASRLLGRAPRAEG